MAALRRRGGPSPLAARAAPGPAERLGLSLLGGLAFGLAQPNPLFPRGLGLLAFFFFLPTARALRGLRPGAAALQGFLFAVLGFGLMNAWLANYDPLAPLLVIPIVSLYYALLFAALSFLERGAPRWFWLTAPLAWVGMEELRTLGFLGYPYGILGYALYRELPLAQAAALAGVQALSALALWPQALLSAELGAEEGRAPLLRSQALKGRRRRGALVLGTLALAWLLGLGRLQLPPAGEGGSLRIALLQPALRSGPKSLADHRADLALLLAESRRALEAEPELLAWPETALSLSIEYHLRHRRDPEFAELAREARDFIAASPADLLFGNDHGVEGPAGERLDYNAALAYASGGGPPEVYAKSRLVPFGEWFPYGRLFPRFRDFLEVRAGGFWEPGPGPSALPLAGTRIGAPICFEDGFGELVRAMAEPGVGLILPLVNDGWARSEAAERQHLAMSVFRAIETGRPVARCTNTGITALIDGRGRVLEELARGRRGVLVGELRLAEGARTPYLALGDSFARACLGAALAALLASGLGRLGAARPGEGRASGRRGGRPRRPGGRA